ncbi:MAG: rhodanese-like domain-containing protein [Terracidiphilus sp.]|nr:rhodanese-like domain-containing protein [Terracidiphilus sp.]
MSVIPQISVSQLKQRIDSGNAPYIVDVREPFEYQICNIGARLIPMNEVPARLAEIPRDREVVLHCKSGVRSQRVAEFLAQSGYTNVSNLAGGILAWASEIDPAMQKY